MPTPATPPIAYHLAHLPLSITSAITTHLAPLILLTLLPTSNSIGPQTLRLTFRRVQIGHPGPKQHVSVLRDGFALPSSASPSSSPCACSGSRCSGLGLGIFIKGEDMTSLYGGNGGDGVCSSDTESTTTQLAQTGGALIRWSRGQLHLYNIPHSSGIVRAIAVRDMTAYTSESSSRISAPSSTSSPSQLLTSAHTQPQPQAVIPGIPLPVHIGHEIAVAPHADTFVIEAVTVRLHRFRGVRGMLLGILIEAAEACLLALLGWAVLALRPFVGVEVGLEAYPLVRTCGLERFLLVVAAVVMAIADVVEALGLYYCV